jgi:hypothetical protein
VAVQLARRLQQLMQLSAGLRPRQRVGVSPKEGAVQMGTGVVNESSGPNPSRRGSVASSSDVLGARRGAYPSPKG